MNRITISQSHHGQDDKGKRLRIKSHEGMYYNSTRLFHVINNINKMII